MTRSSVGYENGPMTVTRLHGGLGRQTLLHSDFDLNLLGRGRRCRSAGRSAFDGVDGRGGQGRRRPPNVARIAFLSIASSIHDDARLSLGIDITLAD